MEATNDRDVLTLSNGDQGFIDLPIQGVQDGSMSVIGRYSSSLGEFGMNVPELSNSGSDITGLGNNHSQPRTKKSENFLQELEALKPVIKKLYIDNGLRFREVQKVLSTQHHYNLSERQFATLRRKWGMKKNIRKEDRHKLLQTIDNTGISEEGFLGGVSLNKEKIKRWRTEIDNRTTSVNHAQCDKESTMSSRNLVKNFARTSGPRFRTLFPKSQLTRQLVSPPNLHITEDLLHSINLYISGMYAQKLWKPVRNGDHHISSAIEHESQQTLDKFYSGCMAAFSLLQAKSYVEARRVLSSACSLVRSVVLSSHPETLSRFLDIFYDLQHGKFGPLHEVLNLLRNYIGRMAMEVLPRAHPWRNICYLLGKIDIKELDQTMLRSAKYMADVSGREGGKISDIYLDSQLLYIQWAHVNQLSEEEEALRKLLAEVRAASVGHPRTFMIMQFISASLRKQGRLADYETAGKEFITAAQAYGANQNLFLGFLITALAQYLQGKKAEAEANQRQGVTIILGLSEPQRFTWAMQHLSRLEQWLREWGHSEDAEQTKAEIDGLVRQDTASEEELLDLNE